MKRRLDLALALVHEPRLLFLDEPTTGLDVQSRTALWDEVTRLSRQNGVTVFLTTQYLEEADALAQRVGIIDTGTDRRRGNPRLAQGRDRAPHGRGDPRNESDLERDGARLCAVRRAGSGGARRRRRAPRRGQPRSWRPVVRALDAENIAVPNLEIHAPTLDDVFLAKTGKRLEGAAGRRARRPRAAHHRRDGGRRRVTRAPRPLPPRSRASAPAPSCRSATWRGARSCARSASRRSS